MFAQADNGPARPTAETIIGPQSWGRRSLAVFLERFGPHVIRELYLQVASDLRAPRHPCKTEQGEERRSTERCWCVIIVIPKLT